MKIQSPTDGSSTHPNADGRKGTESKMEEASQSY